LTLLESDIGFIRIEILAVSAGVSIRTGVFLVFRQVVGFPTEQSDSRGMPVWACRLASSKGQTGSNAGAQSHRADCDMEHWRHASATRVSGGSLVAERVDYVFAGFAPASAIAWKAVLR
jgi:hypothetical protein